MAMESELLLKTSFDAYSNHGKYNFNNDKSTESVYGFRDIPGFDNSKVECWEVLNNGDPIALFKTVNNFDKAWSTAFEGRYPDGNTEVTNPKLKVLVDSFELLKPDDQDYKPGYTYIKKHSRMEQ